MFAPVFLVFTPFDFELEACTKVTEDGRTDRQQAMP